MKFSTVRCSYKQRESKLKFCRCSENKCLIFMVFVDVLAKLCSSIILQILLKSAKAMMRIYFNFLPFLFFWDMTLCYHVREYAMQLKFEAKQSTGLYVKCFEKKISVDMPFKSRFMLLSWQDKLVNTNKTMTTIATVLISFKISYSSERF